MTAVSPPVATRSGRQAWFLPLFVLAWFLIWAITLGIHQFLRAQMQLLQHPVSQFLVFTLPITLPALLGGLATTGAAAWLGITRSVGRLGALAGGWLAAGLLAAWLPMTLVRLLRLYEIWPQGLGAFNFLLGGLLLGLMCGLIALLALTPTQPGQRRAGGSQFVLGWTAAFLLGTIVYYVLFIHMFRIASPGGNGVATTWPGIFILMESAPGQAVLDVLRPLGRLAFETGFFLLSPSNVFARGVLAVLSGPLMGLAGGAALLGLARTRENVDEPVPAVPAVDKSQRQHSGCLRAFLVLAVIANALLALVNLLLLADDPDLVGYAILNALIGLVASGSAFAVLKWKRWGVYGFVGAAVAGILVSLAIGAGGDALRTIIPIVLLLALVGPSWSYMD